MSEPIKTAAPPPFSRLKPYPEYKGSGVEWLGEIPAHWEAKRLKRLFKVVNGSTPRSEEPSYWDGDIPWVTPDDLGELTSRELLEPRRYITEDGYRSCGTSMVPSGSLVLSTRAPIGHLVIAGVYLCTNQGCRSLVFCKDHNRYFFYYLLFAAHSELESWGQGSTFKELAKSKLEYISLVDLPLHEQLAIVSFLDRETAKIDALISKRERLIELLQEKRTALISQAVTKGLDPNVQMKDSGVDWLGEIPAHWDVMRLKWVGKAIIGLTYDPSDLVDEHEGTLVLRASNVSDRKIVLGDNVFVRTEIPERLVTKVGDILICSRSGSRGLIGKSAKIDEDSAGVTFGVFMTIFRSPHNDYLFHVSNSKLFDYQSGAFLTSTINQLTLENLYSFEVPVPPLDEQSQIASFLDRETVQIDTLISKVKESIDMLYEYRTALISAAVTGKIDVRGEVVR